MTVSHLTEDQRGKLFPPLGDWLDGRPASALGLAHPEGDETHVHVSVYFEEEPGAADLPALEALGLRSYGSSPVLMGTVSRDAMLTLARDPRVQLVEPVDESSTEDA